MSQILALGDLKQHANVGNGAPGAQAAAGTHQDEGHSVTTVEDFDIAFL